MKRMAVYVGNGRVLTRTANGFKLFVDARDVSIAPHLILDGVWEEHTEAVLRTLVRPGMTIVEIGANLGYFTLLMAQRAGSAGAVHAFECDPALAQLARDNLEVNGLSNVANLHEMAVSDREGAMRFFTAERHRGGGTLVGGLAQIPELTAAERREIEVRSITLDAFAATLSRPIDLIKIDAEGAEPAILHGGRDVFSRRAPLTVVMEFCPAFFTQAGSDPEARLAELEGWGFRLSRIDERKRKASPVTRAALLNVAYSELVLRRP